MDEAVGRPLEEDPPPEGRRRLAGDGCDHPIEVEARQAQPGRERLARRLMVVQRVRKDVHEGDEGVGRSAHATMMSLTLLPPLDRACGFGTRVIGAASA